MVGILGLEGNGAGCATFLVMQQVTPPATTVARLCRELGFRLDDGRIARGLTADDQNVHRADLGVARRHWKAMREDVTG